jgi:hypothetical protein
MAQYDLYVDTVGNALVAGPANASPADFPRLVQGDTVYFNIYLLSRTTTYPLTSPFAIINNSGLSIKVAIGPKDGTAGSTLLTQQFTWTPDSANQYFNASLPLNTANITSAIGSGQSTTSWFEIEMSQSGFPTTVLQLPVTIQAEVIDTANIVAPGVGTTITAEEINASFLKKTNQGFVLQCPTNAAVQVYVWLGADGVVHFDPMP